MAACPPIDAQALKDRVEGRVRGGTVELSDFDMGMLYTMGGILRDGAFWLIGNQRLSHSDKYPGVPIIFDTSDDLMREFELPLVVLRRESVEADMRRWHPGAQQYRAPAQNAQPLTVGGRTGYDRYETLQVGVPFNFTYVIVLMARNRGGNRGGPISDAQALLNYMMRRFQPYCCVYVPDSDYSKTGVLRTYQAFTEGYAPQPQIFETLGRAIGYELTVRIEGHLDLNDPQVQSAVTALPTINIQQKP